MAKKIRFGVIGDKEVVKALSGKLNAVEVGLEGVAHAAARPIRDQAAENAPHRTGNLAAHLSQETLHKTPEQVVVGVGPDDQAAWYGLFVEFGTEDHLVARDQAQGLEIERGQFAAQANVSGAAPQPFLRPALDSQADAALREAAKELRQVLGLK